MQKKKNSISVLSQQRVMIKINCPRRVLFRDTKYDCEKGTILFLEDDWLF